MLPEMTAGPEKREVEAVGAGLDPPVPAQDELHQPALVIQHLEHWIRGPNFPIIFV